MPQPDAYTVLNEVSGAVVASDVHLAGNSELRRKGLLRHSQMPPGFGLWIAPCEAVHTFFMRFPIDVIFLDKQQRVVKVVNRLKPWRISLALRAHSVLEIEAGSAARSAVLPGIQLRFNRA